MGFVKESFLEEQENQGTLTLFTPPMRVKESALNRTFPKGGVILWKKIVAQDKTEDFECDVYAYVEDEHEYYRSMVDGYSGILAEARDACPEDVQERALVKKKDWTFFNRPKLYKAEEDFYLDTYIDDSCREIGRWLEDISEVYIIYDSERRYSDKKGMIVAYGVTNLPKKTFIEKCELPFKPVLLSYVEYVEKFKLVMAEKEANKSKAMTLQNRIKDFVERPGAYKLLLDKLNERVLGQEQLHIVAQNVFYWLRGIAKGVSTKNNTILVAPSGCGKTELFRTLKAVLDDLIGDIPVSCKDLSLLTTEGFKGADSKYLIADLFQADTNGIGIVMLDEADKKMLPCFSNSGDNVNKEVQGQILTMIEGAVFYEKDNSAGGKSVDTNNTLFIAAGAFQYIRDKRGQKKSLGFGSVAEEKTKEYITREDMIAAGAMPEFVGRFNSVINFQKLDKDSVMIIANRFAKELSTVIGCEVLISEQGGEELYERFLETEMGCRMLKTWIYEPVYEVGNQILLEDSSVDGVRVIYNGQNDIEVEWPVEEKAC